MGLLGFFWAFAFLEVPLEGVASQMKTLMRHLSSCGSHLLPEGYALQSQLISRSEAS